MSINIKKFLGTLSPIDKEKKQRDESRDYIKSTHDIVIRTETNLLNLTNNHDKLESRFNDHLNLERNCPKEETIEAIGKYNEEQNGHIKNIQLQGKQTQEKLDEVLNVTKGKKAVITMAAVVTTGIIGTVGTIAGLIYGVTQLIEYIKS